MLRLHVIVLSNAMTPQQVELTINALFLEHHKDDQEIKKSQETKDAVN